MTRIPPILPVALARTKGPGFGVSRLSDSPAGDKRDLYSAMDNLAPLQPHSRGQFQYTCQALQF